MPGAPRKTRNYVHILYIHKILTFSRKICTFHSSVLTHSALTLNIFHMTTSNLTTTDKDVKVYTRNTARDMAHTLIAYFIIIKQVLITVH